MPLGPTRGGLLLTRDRRRQALGTGAFSLLVGVVALLLPAREASRLSRAAVRVGPDVLVGPRSDPAGTEAGAMGGTASTRRVTFEADENENITVVKGIRVSAGGGRRVALELGPNAVLAAPAFSALGPPCCPSRSLDLWEEARNFKIRNIHSEKVVGCVPGARHCAGTDEGAGSPQSSLLTSCRTSELLPLCAGLCPLYRTSALLFCAHLSLSG